jgi:hypothetical protein
MMRKQRLLPSWFLGLVLLVASVAGTFAVLHSRAGDGIAKQGLEPAAR